MTSEWISVEERLPEKCTPVLVYTEMHNRHVASFGDDDEWFCDYGGEWLFPNVTHWMPLPASPEVQSMLQAIREAESDGMLTTEEAEAFRAFRPQSTVKPVALPRRSS